MPAVSSFHAASYCCFFSLNCQQKFYTCDHFDTIANLKEKIATLQSQLKEHSQCSELIIQQKYNIDFIVSEYEKSKSQLKELLDKNYELHFNLDDCRKVEDNLKQELFKLNYQLDNFQLEKETLQLELKQVCLENANKNAEKNNCALKLETLQEDIKSLREKFEVQRLENKNVIQQRDDIECSSKIFEADAKKMMVDNTNLRAEVKSYSGKTEALAAEVRELKEKITDLQADREAKIHASEKTHLETQYLQSAEIEKLAVECELLRTQLQAKSMKEVELYEKISASQKLEDRLSKDLEMLQLKRDVEVTELKEELEILEVEKEKTNDECSTLQMALHRELSKVVGELQSTKDQLQGKHRSHEILKREFAELRETHNALELKLSDLETIMDLEEKLKQSMVDTKEFLDVELSIAKQKIDELQTEVDASKAEVVELLQKANGLGECNLRLQTENSELFASKENNSKERDRLKAKCSKLQLELATMSRDYDALRKEVSCYRLSANELSEDIDPYVNSPSRTTPARKPINTTDKLKHQVHKLQNRFLDLQEGKDSLQNQFGLLRSENQQVEKRLKELQAKYDEEKAMWTKTNERIELELNCRNAMLEKCLSANSEQLAKCVC